MPPELTVVRLASPPLKTSAQPAALMAVMSAVPPDMTYMSPVRATPFIDMARDSSWLLLP